MLSAIRITLGLASITWTLAVAISYIDYKFTHRIYYPRTENVQYYYYMSNQN